MVFLRARTIAAWLARPGFLIGTIVLAIAILVHVVLRSTIVIDPPGNSPYDELLFLTGANNLLHDNWLGAWDNLTLLKGAGWPIALSVEMFLHLPPFSSVSLVLFMNAGLIIAAAVLLSSRFYGAAAVGAAFWILNPVYFSSMGTTRLLRDQFYGQLIATVLLCVFVIAVASTRRSGAGRVLALIGVGALGGAAFAASWITREERQWPDITVGLALLAAVVFIFRQRIRIDRIRSYLIAALAATLCATVVAVGLISTNMVRNQHYYGAYLANDMVEGEFPVAYGELKSITVPGASPREAVPLSRAQREAAYRVSAHFAQLQQTLEVRNGWINAGCPAMNVCDDLAGGWVTFALRDASSGIQINTEVKFQRYWRAVADEVRSACETGTITCGAYSGLLPNLSVISWRQFGGAVLVEVSAILTGSGETAGGPPPDAPAKSLAIWNETYGVKHEPNAFRNLPGISTWAMVYQLIILAALVAGAAAYRRRGVAALAAVLGSLVIIASVVLRTLLLALADVSAFPAVGGSDYSMESYELWGLLGAIVVMPIAGWLIIRRPACPGTDGARLSDVSK